MSPVPMATQAQNGRRTGQVGPIRPAPPVEVLRGLGREIVVDWQLTPSDTDRRS